MTDGRMQFNRALMASLGLFVLARPAAADCPASRAGRTGLILGTYAVSQAVAIAFRHDDWWHPPRRSFHVVWGGSPSKGQDGLLHLGVTYHATQLADLAWRWACVREPAAAWLAAATGFALGLPKEIGDGFHQNGFSGTDMMFTTIGAVVPALHRTWPPSRAVSLKVFYWPSEEFRNKVGSLPQLENDYAGQRYFLSINPARGGATAWPRWLGLGVGHSVPTWASLPPSHRWYVTLDIDLGGLPVRAKGWKTFATVVDQIHIPMPGVRSSSGTTNAGIY